MLSLKISSYKLIIKATDSGPIISLSSAVTVNVEILDVNDNPPQFSLSNYSAVIQVSYTMRSSF